MKTFSGNVAESMRAILLSAENQRGSSTEMDRRGKRGFARFQFLMDFDGVIELLRASASAFRHDGNCSAQGIHQVYIYIVLICFIHDETNFLKMDLWIVMCDVRFAIKWLQICI